MPTVKDMFIELSRRHQEVTARNDLEGLRAVSSEFEALLNDAPHESALVFALATTKMQLGLNGVAINLLEHTVARTPDAPEIWNNLGTAYKGENRTEDAERCFKQAWELKPHTDYANNISTLYINEGHPNDGIEWARRAIALDNNNFKAHWNLGLLLLELGEWDEGLGEYEYGLLSGDRPNRNYQREGMTPMWDGERGRVVVYGEQGLGDEIMYSGWLPELIKTNEVVLDCHPRLMSVFRRSFPGVSKIYGTRKDMETSWPIDDPVDYRMPIASLVWKFGPRKLDPWLKPDLVKVAKYRARLEATGPGPYVGVGWTGGAKRTRNDLRSVKLSQFKPLFAQGGTFVSMQYNAGIGEKVERFKKDSGYTLHHWPEAVETPAQNGSTHDYDETIALAAALDLVVCVNTTLVHVCGALGQECWTLTPDAPAWRYQLEGDEMPFYKTVRQYRRQGDWDAAIARLVRDYAGAFACAA